MPLECNRNAMEALVQALESGDYPQAKGLLRAEDEGNTGYCCVGVACDISHEGFWMKPEPGSYGWGMPSATEWQYVTQEGFSAVTMPKAVVEWLGLKPDETQQGYPWSSPDALPLSPYEDEIWEGKRTYYKHGTNLNDSGETFKEIAQRIRDTYLTDEPAETPAAEPALD